MPSPNTKHMEKIEWKTLRVKFAVGESFTEKEISLPSGKRIVAAAIAKPVPTVLINLGLFENGNEVSAPMDLEFWKKSEAGQYLDGLKPLGYNGGATVSARLSATNALATAIEVEIVFGIIKDDPTC